MSLRVEEDVRWYMSGENKEMQLSEDGFCNSCGEFHSDCFCKAYWVRQAISFKAQLGMLREEIEILRKYGNKDCTAMADTILEEVRKRR